MIVETLTRGKHQVMNIHKFPVSGKYGFEVTIQGVSDNQNWPETFDTIEEAIAFAIPYGWIYPELDT